MTGNEAVHKIIDEVKKVIVGKDDVIVDVITAFIADGHVLIDDIPGVGKTSLALALSKAMSLKYNRMQFTPDVLPSDVTGFTMYNKKTSDFEFKEGAIMCNLFLADEINRTSSKTQAALLEVMEEAKVTVDGITHYLPDPFFVIATQNPMGYVGTQKLPESQLDRFMIRLSMGYPDMESEIDIYNGKSNKSLDKVKKVIDIDIIREIRNKVSEVNMDEKLMIYLVSFIRETRENEYISLGVSPRGGIALMKMAKSRAFMDDRDYVVPEDIINSIEPVTVHRVVLNSKAKANGLDEKQVLELVKKSVAIP